MTGSGSYEQLQFAKTHTFPQENSAACAVKVFLSTACTGCVKVCPTVKALRDGGNVFS